MSEPENNSESNVIDMSDYIIDKLIDFIDEGGELDTDLLQEIVDQ